MPPMPGSESMSELAVIASHPDVKSVVRCDLHGVLLDTTREADPESVAAVMGLLTSVLVQGGDHLGLGGLSRVLITGAKSSILLLAQGEALIHARVVPPASIAAVEKALDAALQGRR